MKSASNNLNFYGESNNKHGKNNDKKTNNFKERFSFKSLSVSVEEEYKCNIHRRGSINLAKNKNDFFEESYDETEDSNDLNEFNSRPDMNLPLVKKLKGSKFIL